MIRRKCRVCPVIKPMRAKGHGFCSRQCWAIWREQDPTYVQNRQAGIQRVKGRLKPSYVKRVRAEVEALVPQQATFSRREVLGMLVRARSHWRTEGWKSAAQKLYRRQVA